MTKKHRKRPMNMLSETALRDDSPRLQAGSFWNDSGVSSHTTRSVHAQQRDTLKATAVWHGTQNMGTLLLLPSGTIYQRMPKQYSVVCVQKNYSYILLCKKKVEMLVAFCLKARAF